MGWSSFGDAVCDSCGDVRPGDPDRHKAIQIIRAAGWHHAIGETIGGQPYEHILCKEDACGEHKRPKRILHVDQEEVLPIDWESTRRTHEPGSGVTSR